MIIEIDEKYVRATTVRDLVEVLSEAIKQGKIAPTDSWHGWDDGCIVVHTSFSSGYQEKLYIQNE